MSTLVDQERDKYAEMWAVDSYHANSPGESCVPFFLDMATPTRDASVLDAGCGSGRGALALREAGYRVSLCDLVDVRLPEIRDAYFYELPLWSELSTEIEQHDWVYCCDVMEHIPTPFTMLVVRQLLSVARKGVFFSISFMPDNFGALIGKTLHHTVQTFPQWRDQLDTVGHVIESRDLLSHGLFLVERR